MKDMARPIKETPILHCKDAYRFMKRMTEKNHKESQEQREKRLQDYQLALSIFKK